MAHYNCFIFLVEDSAEKIQDMCVKIIEEDCFDPCPSSCNTSAPFRSFDGCCNNLNHTDYGRAPKKFARILGPAYVDGGLPRGSADTSNLPNPRNVSRAVHRPQKESKSTKASLMLMQFGQFLDHDISLTPNPSGMLLSSAFSLTIIMI